MSSAAEHDVVETEQRWVVVRAPITELSWTHKEIEPNPNDFSNTLCLGVTSDVVLEDIVEDCGW